MSATVTIDKYGRITIPKKMREALHLTPGTRLQLELFEDGLKLTRIADAAQRMNKKAKKL
jgi:AbrB family looped-hinge helix DNA binding protein